MKHHSFTGCNWAKLLHIYAVSIHCTSQERKQTTHSKSEGRAVALLHTKALGGLFVKAGQWLANMAATPLVSASEQLS